MAGRRNMVTKCAPSRDRGTQNEVPKAGGGRATGGYVQARGVPGRGGYK